MPPSSEFIRGVEWLWLIWLSAGLAAAAFAIRGLRDASFGDLRRLLAEEDGASYSLAYVMTMPFYVMLMAFLIETTFILIAKMGTVYAAYAAARVNIVYRSFNESAADARSREAAVRAMLPFASSSQQHASGSGGGSGSGQYDRAYQQYAPDGYATSSMIQKKYSYAQKSTQVKIHKEDNKPTGLVRVDIRYSAPFEFDVVGKVLGQRNGGYYVVELPATAALPDEQPVSEDHTLGIRYAPPK